MRSSKHSINILMTTIVLTLIWIVFISYRFAIPEIKKALSLPIVEVKFSEPVFGISGIVENNNRIIDNNQLKWERIDGGTIRVIDSEKCELPNYITYVDLDQTYIFDTSSAGKDTLSKNDLCELFTLFANNNQTSLDSGFILGELPDSLFYDDRLVVQYNFDIRVTGRYQGSIHITHYPIRVSETNYYQVWNIFDHLPYMTIILCLASAVFIAGLGFVILKMTKNTIRSAIVLSVSELLLMLFVLIIV